MLFVPASAAEKLPKIQALNADAFILDLEDSVAPSQKQIARDNARQTVEQFGSRIHLYVRVNSPRSSLIVPDLESVTTHGLAGLSLPKVEGPDDVLAVDQMLSDLEHDRKLSVGAIRLIVTIETVAGIRNCRAIARSSRRIRALCFGAGDLRLQLGVAAEKTVTAPNPALVFGMCELVYASVEVGLDAPHDGAYTDIENRDGVYREALFARSIGFGGKHAIHPNQLVPISNAFRTDGAALERAERIVEAYDLAVSRGLGAIRFEDELIDFPLAEAARAVLDHSRSATDR
jgi:citrate lyase beta subunit